MSSTEGTEQALHRRVKRLKARVAQLGQLNEQYENENDTLRARVAELEWAKAECRRVTVARHVSEQRFQQFMNTVADVVYRYDPASNRYDFISPSFEAQTGYSLEAVQADPGGLIRKITHPDDAERVFQEVADHVRKGPGAGPIVSEYRVVRKDGEVIWVHDVKTPEFGADGKLHRIDGVVSDVTCYKRAEERLSAAHGDLEKRVQQRTAELAMTNEALKCEVAERAAAEDALREGEARLRAVFEAARHVSFVITDVAGQEAKILEFSPGAEQIFGYRREEVLGKPLGMFHLPEDVERFPEVIEAMRQGKEGFAGESTLVRKSGERFPALFTTYPLCDDEGTMIATLGVSLDISERKRAEQALRESEERYRALTDDVLDSSAGGVFILDADFRVIWINQALEHFFGLRRKDVVGRDKRQLIREQIASIFEDPQAFQDKVLATYDNNTYVESFECHVLARADREERWLEHQSLPIRSGLYAGGRIEHYYDVTQRKRAEEAARMIQVQLIARQQYETERVQVELEKVRDELIRKTRLATIGQVSASIAHELRNPLGTVRNAAYYLKRHAPGRDPKLAEYLSIIEQETSTADAIISNLTEMTRLREPAKQAVDFGRMVQEVFDRAELPQEIGWRLSLEPEPFVLHADAGQLRQVVGNLVTNAVQALEERGQILVVASRSADYDTITFKDSGPGVAPAVRERLFEPLVTTRAKGTGLGLTICRQIIQQHGGTIELADQEGRGAAFRIRLPC